MIHFSHTWNIFVNPAVALKDRVTDEHFYHRKSKNKSAFLLLVFVSRWHNPYRVQGCFLGGASSAHKTNLPASAIKYILISYCTDPGLYTATPPSMGERMRRYHRKFSLTHTKRTDCSGEVQISLKYVTRFDKSQGHQHACTQEKASALRWAFLIDTSERPRTKVIRQEQTSGDGDVARKRVRRLIVGTTQIRWTFRFTGQQKGVHSFTTNGFNLLLFLILCGISC